LENQKEPRLACLIDADNVSCHSATAVMEEIARYGTLTLRRVYGDFQKPMLSGWKTAALENAILPIQQYSYTSGKNATDSALIIDAMDIFYSGCVDGFCIVSGDSDFTRLAIRLREGSMKVYGVGNLKTPRSLIRACNKFIFLEHLHTKLKTSNTASMLSISVAPAPVKEIDHETTRLIEACICDLADDTGWAFLGDVSNLILKRQPDFNARSYGFPKFVRLLASLPSIEIERRSSQRISKPVITQIFVRAKDGPPLSEIGCADTGGIQRALTSDDNLRAVPCQPNS